MQGTYDALVLFSGGLDSILAAKVIARLGFSVLGVHFTTPFFGKPGQLAWWERTYGIEVLAVDAGRDFIDMMAAGPPHGFGKHLNPCVDCKVLLMTRAKDLMARFGAGFLVSGEVLGQRPMSQRRDTLDLILKAAGVRDLLLRPLSAQKLRPTPMEESGLVDRSRLLGLFGRGRNGQMDLAREFGITEIPTPAGGCRLTEAEAAKRYLPLIARKLSLDPADYALANEGRQYWRGDLLLALGRTQRDNDRLADLARPTDLVLRLKDQPGPTAVGRSFANAPWTPEAVNEAAALVAWHSPKARAAGTEVEVNLRRDGTLTVLRTTPGTDAGFTPPSLEAVEEWKRARRKDR